MYKYNLLGIEIPEDINNSCGIKKLDRFISTLFGNIHKIPDNTINFQNDRMSDIRTNVKSKNSYIGPVMSRKQLKQLDEKVIINITYYNV